MSRAIILLLFLPMTVGARTPHGPDAGRIDLREGWSLQSSAKVREGGEALSRSGYETTGWYRTSVPSTVLAAQVASGEFGDPYFGMNLRKIPGTTYPVATNFSHLPMPSESPYARSWWYRTEFRLPEGFAGRRVWLDFAGINYRANVWLNGRKVAGDTDVAGMYRTYEFDITDSVNRDGANALAVETFAPSNTDLALNWVDWNPMAPDKSMGLWNEVSLVASGPVTVRAPMVATRLADDAGRRRADLTVVAEVRNATDAPVEGTLSGEIGDLRFSRKVALGPREGRTVRFTPDEFPQLRVAAPKLWWPVGMGEQTLHDLSLSFAVGEEVSDRQTARFGIREVTSELNAQGARLFRVNGKPVFIRGGGWAPDMMLRHPSRERLEAEFQYVLDLGLNTIRLEGKMESQEFFDLADERGILVMAGWCCCDQWEQWDKWQPGLLNVATESLRSQILRLRRHPSFFVWLNASDMPATPEVESAYIKVLEQCSWPNPYLSSATQEPSKVTGPTGVKMTGPYDFVAPSYWLTDTKNGGAYGFNTETGPGPAIPTVRSLRRMLPADHLWPIDEYWNFHAGGQEFKDLNRFNDAMRATYGPPAGLDDYVNKAQAMAYASERAMFEAYQRNRYATTGVVQWMLNNAWPSVIWHLYDYYLMPAGGYFGVKKANEPLHVQFSYDDRTVAVVNNTYRPADLKVDARLYDLDLKEKFSKQATMSAGADSVLRPFAVPAEALRGSNVSFLRLDLSDPSGRIVSRNFYWLPAKFTEFDWKKTFFVHTPAKEHEDMRAIAALPRAALQAAARIERGESADWLEVTVTNPGRSLAFQASLTAVDAGTDEQIVPIYWEDNYVSLMPGESRTLRARLPEGAAGRALAVEVDGLNVEKRLVRPAVGR